MAVRDIATAHGTTASAVFRDGYPVTVNDAADAHFAAEVAADLLGKGRCHAQPGPLTGAEDFSFVLQPSGGQPVSPSPHVMAAVMPLTQYSMW